MSEPSAERPKQVWREKAQKVYQERGYLVIARHSPYKLGAIITTLNLPDCPAVPCPQPFRVVAETNYADYEAQHRRAGESLYGTSSEYHFYRVLTD